MEQGIANAAKDVSDGSTKSANQLANQLSKIVPTDSAFEAAFSNARPKPSLARYYLRSLELKRKGDPEPEWIPNDDIAINLEHVLPENPDGNWQKFDAAMQPVYYNRLGNMVLLQATVNSDIGNKSFAVKRKTLNASDFSLTKEVAAKSDWTPQEIDQRQASMAKEAVLLWPMKAS